MLSSGYLLVSGGHTIYYEVHGAAHGRNAIELHGGPGGGLCRDSLKQYDLKKWRVVLFDQRGCGKSTPFLRLEHNTTSDLIEDIEMLRCFLGVDQWFISGGSWGTTLGLLYAETYPQHVSGLLLRAVCLCNRASNAWLYGEGGVSRVFPKEWEEYISMVPATMRHADWKTIVRYYQQKLRGPSAQAYADAWWGLERRISRLIPPTKNRFNKEQTLAIATIENHYFAHDCWIKEDQILKNLSALKHIPITMIHGRYDMICPFSNAYTVKEILPHAKLIIIPTGGHGSPKSSSLRVRRHATNQMFGQTRCSKNNICCSVFNGARTRRRKRQRHSQRHATVRA
jgi:proline iminopeptidase